MKLKKLLIQLVMLIGVGFVLLPYSAQTALALTSDNTTTTIDDVKVDLKQIKEIARPTWQIINSNDVSNYLWYLTIKQFDYSK